MQIQKVLWSTRILFYNKYIKNTMPIQKHNSFDAFFCDAMAINLFEKCVNTPYNNLNQSLDRTPNTFPIRKIH